MAEHRLDAAFVCCRIVNWHPDKATRPAKAVVTSWDMSQSSGPLKSPSSNPRELTPFQVTASSAVRRCTQRNKVWCAVSRTNVDFSKILNLTSTSFSSHQRDSTSIARHSFASHSCTVILAERALPGKAKSHCST